jgi:hypothetical protein
MAIASTQYYLIRDLHQRGLTPQGGALLEIGEANWYGDLEPLAMIADIERFVGEPARRQALVDRLTAAVNQGGETARFDVAKVFYELFFAPANMQAIDFHGTPSAHRMDLNYPITLDRRFDVVFNQGTAEHIFDIARVFVTIHDWTLPGGLMIHESPLTGWIDHGFYTLQPTLFIDTAETNEYQILGMFVEDFASKTVVQMQSRDSVVDLAESKSLPDNAMLFTVLRKVHDRPFEVPIQGYYRSALSDRQVKAWKELR